MLLKHSFKLISKTLKTLTFTTAYKFPPVNAHGSLYGKIFLKPFSKSVSSKK